MLLKITGITTGRITQNHSFSGFLNGFPHKKAISHTRYKPITNKGRCKYMFMTHDKSGYYYIINGYGDIVASGENSLECYKAYCNHKRYENYG